VRDRLVVNPVLLRVGHSAAAGNRARRIARAQFTASTALWKLATDLKDAKALLEELSS